MASAKTKVRRTGTGKTCVDFDDPIDPMDLNIFSMVPYDARVRSVTIEFERLPREAALAWKRHDAAVKANATRKAKKEEKKP